MVPDDLERQALELAKKDIAAHIRGYVKEVLKPEPTGITVPVPERLRKEIRQLRLLLDMNEPLEDSIKTKREARQLSNVLIEAVRGKL